MKNYQLAEGESVLYLLADASVLITDKRIRKLSSPGEVSGMTSIMLEDVSSINVRHNTHIWSLISGVFLAVIGFGAIIEFDAIGLVGLGLSAALFIYYYQSMESVVEFKSPTDTIKLPVKYLNKENVVDMINKVEHARIISRK